LTLGFTTIPDPDGWHPSLRLKGDWLICAVSDGISTGYGEASHSRDDAGCQRAAEQIFAREYAGFEPSLAALARKERETATKMPDFVTATAYSALNQAMYDLLAKREGVPVWQLFAREPGFDRLPLYTTINRALEERTNAEYVEIVGRLADEGFKTFKCAPFEAVDTPDNAVEKAAAGLRTLAELRDAFPSLGIRVDFHERFEPPSFFSILPRLEQLGLDWVEEPFAMGPDYAALRQRTRTRVAAGELVWGREIFENIAARGWADVIMPDVKHVGGFGPLLDVLEMGRGRIEISPHNPSGPISTAASLHAGALFPDVVRTLEYAYDSAGSRGATGEFVVDGDLFLTDRPGWGVEPV
jgi:galactonate dehydratase